MMQHKVKVTVIDKKLFPELQIEYCADPNSGMCPCYNVGDEFVFERYETADDFWHMGLNTLKQTSNVAGKIAGSKEFPHCSEAWDAISRYIYTGLQGGSIMQGWMNDERVMIACCSDGTRPVINSKYKRTIWQCNAKFKGESKCATPHLYEQRIKKLFHRLVDYATVYPDDRVVFTFRNGAEVSTKI